MPRMLLDGCLHNIPDVILNGNPQTEFLSSTESHITLHLTRPWLPSRPSSRILLVVILVMIVIRIVTRT